MTSIANLVHQKTTSAGTGALTLSSVAGRQGFYAAFGTTGPNAFFYFISHAEAAEWEVGTGHMSDAATLQRDTVIASSSGGAKVGFSAGAKDVVNDVPASYQAKLTQLAAVATSGAYTDLTGKPALAAVATSGGYADLTGKPALATVATSGAYTDLTGKPSLATVATSGAYTDLTGKPSLATVATSGAYTDLTGRPALAAVATTGSYNDLLNGPGVALGNAKKLVLIGDSMTRMNHDGASSTRNCYWGPRGPVAWAQVRLGFPFYCPAGYSESNATQTIGYNTGKGGDTAVGMAARLAADVLALSPDYVYMMAGTNDIEGGDTYANITAAQASIIDACIAHGATVIVETIPARTNAVGANDWGSTSQRKLHQRVNNFLRRKADVTRGMILIDADSRTIDQSSANGNAVAAYSADGLHSSVLGGFWRGDALVEALQGRVSDPRTNFFNPYDLYDSSANPQGNWLANGQMSGTSGTAGTGASGSVSTSWTAERSSGTTITVTASKVTKTQGENALAAQKLVIASPGSGSGMEQAKFRPTTSSFTSGISTGDWFEMECRISVDAATGTAGGIQGIYLNLEDLTTVGGNTTRARCFSNQYSAAGAFPDVAWSGVLKTPPLQLRGTTGLSPSLRIELDAAKNMSVGVTVHAFSVRKLATAPFSYPP